MNAHRPRFPMPRYPTGWFQVAWSDELEPGAVVPLKYFGRDLVLFRSEDGELAALDAHCPHMGAHLGHNGRVEGRGIVCPFHAWRFDPEGACDDIPYASKIPPKAKVACWPVVESNGGIYIWHDIDKGPPTWELPTLPEFSSESWSTPVHRKWRVRTHNQEMAENMVDTAHFKYLHGLLNMPDATVERREHVLTMETETRMSTPGGEVVGNLKATAYGFGFSYNRFTGLVHTLLIGAVAPVDEEYVDVRFSFTIKKFGGHEITAGVGRAFVAEISRQLEQDIPVWENKIFIEPPLLCDGDGPVGLFRQWCKQFFPAWYHAEAYEAYYGRPMPEAR